MEQKELLQFGKTYHIFNRGINKCDIFQETTNYEHFMRLFDRHIINIADILAWALMKNHFHLLVKIKDEDEISEFHRFVNPGTEIELKPPHQYFSNMFNAYAKAYNQKYKRTGSLFQHRFQRKPIEDIDYLRKAIIYIHLNPVHHKFTKDPGMYQWSSYNSIVSLPSDKVYGSKVIGIFDGLGNFIALHSDDFEFSDFENWLNL